MPAEAAADYKSPAQKARVVTEGWASRNLYCPCCDSTSLNATPHNTEAIDFRCPDCASPFQLKSQNSAIGNRIVDAAYDTMMRAIREDRTPNLFVLHYDRAAWRVRDLLLVPRFAFSASAVEKRKPLAPTARRAGWVGCNIVLEHIPPDARIPLVEDGVAASPREVRESFRRLRPLQELRAEERGWTLDVWRVVQGLGKREFTNDDVYGFVPEFERLYPGNRHIRDKIRQQLQVLRDRGFLTPVERGVWAMKRGD
ncbi:MAG: restriction endonuclease [Verrucomicrobia bacterium]|nr:restriction endonuclease [Verrucomicrobiota bacterium]